MNDYNLDKFQIFNLLFHNYLISLKFEINKLFTNVFNYQPIFKIKTK